MMLAGKVDLVEVYAGEVCRSPSIELPMPAVVRLRRHVHVSGRRGVRFSATNIFLRDRHTCQYCGTKRKARELNLDHVIPRSRGGRKTWTNIVASCIPCNDIKRNRTPEEAGMVLQRKPIQPAMLQISTLQLEEARVPQEWARWAEIDMSA
jgi:5-methylcytosine-specific restriction endonuclease McrA